MNDGREGYQVDQKVRDMINFQNVKEMLVNVQEQSRASETMSKSLISFSARPSSNFPEANTFLHISSSAAGT